MEISNRSVGILCATAIVIAVILRTGSSRPPSVVLADAADAPTASAKTATPRSMNADFRFLPQTSSTTDIGEPQEMSSMPPQVIVPDATPPAENASTDDPLAELYPDTSTSYVQGNLSPSLSDSRATWANDPPIDNPGGITDREMFDRLISFMDENERNDFRVIWTAMTPEERQQFLDEMRGTGG